MRTSVPLFHDEPEKLIQLLAIADDAIAAAITRSENRENIAYMELLRGHADYLSNRVKDASAI